VGGIHFYLYFDYFHRVHIIGALFLANAAIGVLIALWLLASDGVLALIAGAGFAATTLCGFLISVQWGLFGFHERFSGTWQSAAGLVELVTVLLLGTLAAESLLRPVRPLAEQAAASGPSVKLGDQQYMPGAGADLPHLDQTP
jgi:hypothetical protein